ncbi:MAG: PilC/PilY family type IV pilus protein [Pseudomonadota bacterium]
MNIRSLIQCLLYVFMLMGLAASPARAQFSSDIDIYGGPSALNDAPNVLIIVDNTANWSSAFTNEIAALVSTVNSLPTNRFRVGLMMFTESGGTNIGNDGGYVRSAIRLLNTESGIDYQTKFKALLNSLDVNNDKSSGGKAGITMAEAYYYFSGKAPYSGGDKTKADYTSNVAGGTTAANAIYALPGNALTSKTATTYVSPVSSVCQRNYIIYISNGAVQDNNSDTTTASALLSAAYTAAGLTRPTDISLSPSGSQSGVADEWARFMKASAHNISTFTLDVDKVTTGQGPGWSAMLNSMAVNSGGEYYSVSSSGTAINLALNQIFNQLQAVDSVFSSASLPVSVNARGTYLNQIFMGMFRPDIDAKPRWRGNLKQYQFAYNPTTDSLYLADASTPTQAAISSTTGFISPSAVSYWTGASTFWSQQLLGTPASSSDSPDGEVVEKGGVAQKIRTAFSGSQSSRKVYTCIACTANTNLATTAGAQFSTSNTSATGVTATALGVSTTTDRDNLIDWVRGKDNYGDEKGPDGLVTPTTVTVRPSVHGDVLHSRPAAVNYGGTTGVVVYYGANDGGLRAVNGNQTGTGAGEELWSFIPQEHFSKLNRIRSNTPEVRLSTTSTVGSLRDYFVDGPIGVYQKVLADGTNDKVYIYTAMRRGGRQIYALDVTTPSAPKFLWKKTEADIAVLGQTWSEPKVAKIRGNANPVIIMGAGYDAASEDYTTRPATTMGNAVLVLDAITGTLLKTFTTDRSVPADVSLVDADLDGYVDRVYAVDLGGNVYRIDLEKTTAGVTTTGSGDWGMFKLASLTGSGTRKFFYPPDVIVTQNFTAVMVGSGDREKPLATTSTDAFFTMYDTRAAKGTPTTFTTLTSASLGLVGSAESVASGCYIPMSTSGEKIVNAPVSVGGITYFSTNQPTSTTNSCSANLGVAKVYSAPLFCKAATSQTLVGGGLPPSPVTGTVTVSYTSALTGLTETKQVPFIIGAPNSKGSGIEGSKVTPSVTPSRTRTFWYLEKAR